MNESEILRESRRSGFIELELKVILYPPIHLRWLILRIFTISRVVVRVAVNLYEHSLKGNIYHKIRYFLTDQF